MLTKRYIQCRAHHIGRNEYIEIDIEISTSEEIVERNDKIVMSNIFFIPTSNQFSFFGIKIIFDTGTVLHEECRQYEYVGSVDEIIQRIISESE